MNCTNCNAVLPENAAFCPTCGTPIYPKHSFCSICGKAFREGENTCSVCEPMNEEQKERTTACTVATSPYRKIAKIAVIVILCLLFVCSVGIRLLFGVVSFWTVLISIVGLIIQLFRGKPLKKFALALGCAVLVVVAAVLLDLLLVYLPVQVEDDMGTQIVGEWEALHSTVNGEVIYLSSGESITLTAKKNGKVYLKSYDSKIDLELYWSYDEDTTERLRIDKEDSTVCVYDLLYGDSENGIKAFSCMAHENDLYIQSEDEIDAGEFSAYFDRVN